MQFGDLPLIAAPMAGGPSTPDLVVAAARADAFGFLAAGYLTPEALAEQLQSVRALTEDVGVNLFVPERAEPDRAAISGYRDRLLGEGYDVPEPVWADDDHWRDKLDLLMGEPAQWVSFTFGLPGESVVEALHDVGTEVAITVTDPGEALAAEDQGADALVVQAATAGGHRGTFDQATVPNDLGLPELLRAVSAVSTLPLVGAGGVGTAGDVRAALGAGAVAVQVGTALLLADEAGTNPAHRAAIGAHEETAVTRAFTGRWARGLRNEFMDRHQDAPAGYPAIHHLTRPLRQAAARSGDTDRLHLWAGTGHRHAVSAPTAGILTSLLG